jgi:autotransporter-associated beta strand protein
MKLKPINHFSKFRVVAGLHAIFVTAVSVSSATEYTWNYGTAGTANLSDASKWLAPNGAIPALGATDAILTFLAPQAASSTLGVTNDFTGTLILNRLNFSNSNDSGTAPTFNLGGNPLMFETNGTTAPFLSLNPTGTTSTSRPKVVISNNVTLSNDLTLSQSNASVSATLSGVIDGSGGLQKTSGAGSVTISNTANSFSGPVVISANGSLSVPMIGNAGSNSALGQSSSITLGGGSNSGQLTWTGTSETTDKVFTLGGSTGGGTIFASPANQTLTISQNLNSGSSTGLTRTLTLGGSGNITSNGAIGNGTGASGGAVAVTKSGSGTATLTATNSSFTGPVTVSQGSLFATSIGNSGFNSSLGTNGTINLGGTTNSGTLRFLGTVAETTDKTINMSGTTGGSTIITRDAVLTVSADLGMSGGGNKTLTLSSSSNTSGVNFNGLLADLNGTLSLRVNGSGTGNNSLGSINNSFSGGVTIDGNIIAKTTALEVALIGNSGNNSSLGTNGTIKLGSATAGSTNLLKYSGIGETSDKVINLVGTLGNGGLDQSAATGLLKFTSDLTATGLGDKTFILQGSSLGTGEFANKIVDSTGFATSLAKYGSGTWTLSAANTYTGATNIAGGTLALSAVGSIDSSTAVTLGAGGTLDTTAQASFTLPAAQTYTFGLDSTASGTSGQIKAADLNIANARIDLSLGISPLDDAEYVIASYTGTLTGTFSTSAPTGYTWNYGTGSNSQITLIQDAAGYDSWKTANAGGQDSSLDWDNDGISNGVEFFMNAPSGFTANPALAAGVISWTNGGNINSAAYGTQYVVQTSDDLVIWSDVPAGELTINSAGPGGSLVYTLTGPGKRFVRLKVSPNP